MVYSIKLITLSVSATISFVCPHPLFSDLFVCPPSHIYPHLKIDMSIEELLHFNLLTITREQAIFHNSYGCHGRDHMVVGFTTNRTISAYHH